MRRRWSLALLLVIALIGARLVPLHGQDLTTQLALFLVDLRAGALGATQTFASLGLASGGAGTAKDTTLVSDAANTLGLRTGTSAQSFNVYNTFTSSANNERVGVDWQTTANVARIGSMTAATGTARNLQIVAQNSSGGVNDYAMLSISRLVNPVFRMGLLNASFTIAASGITELVRLGEYSSNATSGTVTPVTIQPTYNQSASSAANTDLLINRTSTSVGSGAQKLLDAQIGTVSKFSVTVTGGTQVTTSQTTVPACGANCGTPGNVCVGSDTAMTCTMGTTPASGFVITFNGTWAAAPSCTASMALTGMVVGKLPLTVVTTTTTITVTTNGTAPVAADKYSFTCVGIQ